MDAARDEGSRAAPARVRVHAGLSVACSGRSKHDRPVGQLVRIFPDGRIVPGEQGRDLPDALQRAGLEPAGAKRRFIADHNRSQERATV